MVLCCSNPSARASSSKQLSQSFEIIGSGLVADSSDDFWALAADEQVPLWQEPKVYTEQELLAVANKKDRAQLSVLDLMALKIANQQILDSQVQPNGLDLLRKAHADLKSFEGKMIKPAEAQKLDRNPRVLAPIEKQAMDITNALMLGANAATASKGLRAVYMDLLNDYVKSAASKDAEKIYVAMKGLGTDETALLSTLAMRSTDELDALRRAFTAFCVRKGDKAADCNMDAWIRSELSGGDKEKAEDLLLGNMAKADDEYYWSTRAAAWWSGFLKDSDAAAKDMIRNGSWWERGIGHFNQAIFGATTHLNAAVKEAQSFWMERAGAAKENDKGVQSKFFTTMYVLATIGGSFGTKALDPTLPVNEVEEGLMEIAMNLGAMGAAKMVAVASKAAAGTRVGMKALQTLSDAFASIRRSAFSMKRYLGIGQTAAKLEAKAVKLQKIAMEARSAGKIAKADSAAKASASFADAAKNLKNADKARTVADDAIRAAETIQKQLANAADDAARARLVDDYSKAQKAVVDATTDLKKQLDKTMQGINTAKLAGRQVNSLIRNIEKFEAKVKNFFGQDISLWPKGEEAARLKKLSDLRADRLRQPSTLLGTSEDAAKATPRSLDEIKRAEAALKEGSESLFETSHGGLHGAGPKGGQTQYWDKDQLVWRNGPGTVGQSGAVKGKSIAGQVVELSDSGITYDLKTGAWKGPAGVVDTPADLAKLKIDPSGVFKTKAGEAFKFDPVSKSWQKQVGGAFRTVPPTELPAWTKTLDWDAAKSVFKQKVPAANLCQINPSFCKGPNPYFCVKYPELCQVKGLPGRPRDVMPQIEDVEKFVEFLEKKTGKKISVEVGQRVSPAKLTPVQVLPLLC